MPAPAIVWKVPLGTLAVTGGFVAGLLAAYYTGFTSSDVVLSFALGAAAFSGMAALALEHRIRPRFAGRYEPAWLLLLWGLAAAALTYVLGRMA